MAPVPPGLIAYCDQVRAEQGLPDHVLERLLDDMASALIRVRRWPPAARQKKGITEEMIA